MSEIVEGEHTWPDKKASHPTLFSAFNKGLGTETPYQVIRDAVRKVTGGDFPGSFGLEWQLKTYTDVGQRSDKEFGELRQHLSNRLKAITGNAGQSDHYLASDQRFVTINEIAKLVIRCQRELKSTDIDMKEFLDAFLVVLLGDAAREVVEDPVTSLQCPKCSGSRGWRSFVTTKDCKGYLCIECGTEVPKSEACLRKVRRPVNETYLQLCQKIIGKFTPEGKAQNTSSLEQEPIQSIRADRIKLAPTLVRKIDMEYVNDLAESIKVEGVLHPITVRPLKDGFYEVVAGGHRFTALTTILSWPKLPCIVRHMNADEAQLVGIAENIQRNVRLDPIREGEVFRELIEKKGWSIENIARRIGKKHYYVEERIRVLEDLAPALKKELSNGKIAFKNAKWIAKHPHTKQVEIVGKLKRFPNVPKVELATPSTECTHSCPCHCPPF